MDKRVEAISKIFFHRKDAKSPRTAFEFDVSLRLSALAVNVLMHYWICEMAFSKNLPLSFLRGRRRFCFPVPEIGNPEKETQHG